MKISAPRHVAVVTEAPPEAVYAVARDLSRLPEWAAGLAAGEMRIVDDATVELDSPMGRVRAEFCPRNDTGVLDHRVTLPDGSITDNPLRVVAHPAGAEVIFTVRPRWGVTGGVRAGLPDGRRGPGQARDPRREDRMKRKKPRPPGVSGNGVGVGKWLPELARVRSRSDPFRGSRAS